MMAPVTEPDLAIALDVLGGHTDTEIGTNEVDAFVGPFNLPCLVEALEVVSKEGLVPHIRHLIFMKRGELLVYIGTPDR